ncbi:MAG: endopeptidase La [Syntrophorhabdaceae bacterium]|nr:endopeptidase La [Syntrophorhabdaceae bacterium]
MTDDDIKDSREEEAGSPEEELAQEPVAEEKSAGQEIPAILPLLPVRDIVIFPYMTLPLFVGREGSISAVDEALAKDRFIFLATQKDPAMEDPRTDQLYSTGTVAMIMRMIKLPDGRLKILIQGVTKGKIIELVEGKSGMHVRIERIVEAAVKEDALETEALMRASREKIERILSLKNMPVEILMVTENINNPGVLADLVASNLRLKIEEAQGVLEEEDPVSRLNLVNNLLSRELQLAEMQAKIQNQAKEEMSKSQREYFLREQMKAIKQELGDIDSKSEDADELKEKIKNAGMPKEVLKEAEKQMRRLEGMHHDSAESSVIRTYLDWMVELPWENETRDNLRINKARKILDEDHHGLEKVKDRILEYLAVRKLKDDMKGPILCFAGPPGVGKTSLGKSIARAMGRKFIRISLGGIRDEAEIRGHRRTYVGALPGRIIQGMKQAGSRNPVFMLDEIDKVGADFRGDPSAALLEVLDPEQNYAFSDNYLNVPFDLSKVLFIATANVTDPIPPALKDRMEIIRLSGYTDVDKLAIAKKFLLPNQMEANGIKPDRIKMQDKAILAVVNQYTREAGLRNLEREIGRICRKAARGIAEGEKGPFFVTAKNVPKYLGVPIHIPEKEAEADEVGVATGLAWTPTGGDILFIEVSLVDGKGGVTITGNLGDVMRESAQAALTYVRSRADRLGIPKDFHQRYDIHIHVPAGGTQKDGPSAGITIAAALVSSLTGIPARRDVSMTGEITLRGRVLQIGGLKEKTLAALRGGITHVVAPELNRKDLEEIPRHEAKQVTFSFVKNMDEVIAIALTKNPFKAERKKAPRKAVSTVKASAGKSSAKQRASVGKSPGATGSRKAR